MIFNHTGHKEYWQWIANNPELQDYDYPVFKKMEEDGTIPMSGCFACDYAVNIKDEHTPSKCELCPLDWGNGRVCYEEGTSLSLFDDLVYNAQKSNSENDPKYLAKRKQLALKIRDTPLSVDFKGDVI